MDLTTFPSRHLSPPDVDVAVLLAGSRQGRVERGRHRPLVLLIEDDDAIARMYQRGLGHEGFDVVIAEDGPTGLDFIRDRKPDLVLLDIGLPRVDGLEVLMNIQADPELTPKVVVFSNFAEQVTVDASIERGALEYVLKATVTPRELAQILARHLASD